MKSSLKDFKNINTLLGFIIIFAATFTVAFLQSMFASDYSVHMLLAIDANNYLHAGLFYPMWHLGAFGMYKLFRLIGIDKVISFQYACSIFSALVNGIVYLCVVKYFKQYQVKFGEYIAVGVLFVSSLYIPSYSPAGKAPNCWHNPTNMIVKPFAIVGTFMIIDFCERIRKKQTITKKEYGTFTILMLLSVLAKPSFFQGIVPALAVYFIVCLCVDKWKSFMEYFKICLCFVPSFLIVVWQFLLSFFIGGENSEGIGFGLARSRTGINPIIGLFLILAFPILYLLANYKKYLKSTKVYISILFVISTWLQSTLLYENGKRFLDDNFSWAAILAYSFVWILSTRVFFRDFQKLLEAVKNNKKSFFDKDIIINYALLVLWLLHLISGFFYYSGLVMTIYVF